MASNTELELPETPSQRCNFVVRWAPGYGLRERAGRPPKGWDISYYPHLQRRVTRDCEFMCSQNDSISIGSVHGCVSGESQVIYSRDGVDQTIFCSDRCSTLPETWESPRLKIDKAKAVHVLRYGRSLWWSLERGDDWNHEIDQVFLDEVPVPIHEFSYFTLWQLRRLAPDVDERQGCSANFDDHWIDHWIDHDIMEPWKVFLFIEEILLTLCQRAIISNLYDKEPRPGRPKHLQTMTMPWSICTALAVIWGVCWMFYGPQMPGFDDFDGSNPFFQELSAQDMFVWLPDGSIDNLSFNPAPSPQPMMWPGGVPGHTSSGLFTESQLSWAPDMPLLEQGSFVNAGGGQAGSAPVQELLPTTATTGPPNSQGPARQISNPENMFRCNHGSCASAFPTRGRLRAHEKRHTRAWKCLTCNATFGAPKDLARHESTVHQHSNSFKCEILDCPRYHNPFSRQDNLKRHMRLSHGQDQLPYLEVSQGSGSETRSHTHSGDQAGSTPNSMNDKGKSIAEYGRTSSPEQSSTQSVPENGLDQEAVPDNDKENVPAVEKLGVQIENLKKQVAMLKEENWKLKEENSQRAERIRKWSAAIGALI
ncbi:putative C2H2-type domain-containing protein [Seiridium cardinale]|uniref:C2H2-type domain-containing protein n=1 Tax=Seiridium cardinale TaxID=138064 RepID=A0ABR2Y2J6_9PEZI